MDFYTKLEATAARLLAKFGQDIFVTKNAVGLLNPATGVATVDSVTTTEKGVELDFVYRSFGEGFETKTVVRTSNRRVLCTGGSVIESGDSVVINSRSYKVVVAKLVNPAGLTVLYDLWVTA